MSILINISIDMSVEIIILKQRIINVDKTCKILLDAGYEDVAYYVNQEYPDALIGVTTNNIAVYDYNLMIEQLINEGFTEEEATDWISYNTMGAYFGENTPIIMYPIKE